MGKKEGDKDTFSYGASESKRQIKRGFIHPRMPKHKPFNRAYIIKKQIQEKVKCTFVIYLPLQSLSTLHKISLQASEI